MFIVFLRKYKTMILISIFFFYIGCGITLSFLRMECADALTTKADRELKALDSVEYAVLVLTGPDNEARRDTIRATWAKFATNIFVENGEKLYKWNHTWVGNTLKQDLVKIYFVVGTRGLSIDKLSRLTSEGLKTYDLLLLDFEDSYKNLASKVLLSLKWLNDNLKGLKYVMKCDDDSFVRIDLIVRDLEAYGPHMTDQSLLEYVTFKKSLPSYTGLYWGYFDGRAKAFSRGKWQEKDWFLCDTYLPYALGGGYVISQSIVSFLAKNADVLSCYNSEDVSMGVWTAALDGINRVHDIRFDTEWKSRGCNTNMLVRHKQTTGDMFQMYRSLVHSRGEKLCKTEVLDRQSYSYNWHVLPSKCCR